MRYQFPIFHAAHAERRTIASIGLPLVLLAALVLGVSGAGAQVELGDDASRWAHDGQCDDPRFVGAGAAATLLDEDLLHDATDCRALLDRGLVTLRSEDSGRMGSRIERGRLEDGDRRSATGDFADRFRFRGRRGGHALLDLRSADFVPALLVRTPTGKELSAAGAERRSSFALELGEDGIYEVTVASRTAGGSGGYVIAIALQGDHPPVQPLDRAGTLADGDSALQSGELVDTYEIEGWPGQRVSITVESESFDTYVILKTPSGRQVENDDAEGGHDTSDSRIDRELDDIGIYEVLVTSYAPGETGPYRLVIAPGTSVPAAHAPQSERPTLEIATPRHLPGDRGSITAFDPH